MAVGIIFFMVGCDMSDDELNLFKKRLSVLLAEKDSVEIFASELTDFSWDKLCFDREKLLTLTFFYAKSKTIFELDYQEYFVDEPHVKGSLDRQCITGEQKIIVKKKYPEYSETIEFLSANKD